MFAPTNYCSRKLCAAWREIRHKAVRYAHFLYRFAGVPTAFGGRFLSPVCGCRNCRTSKDAAIFFREQYTKPVIALAIANIFYDCKKELTHDGYGAASPGCECPSKRRTETSRHAMPIDLAAKPAILQPMSAVRDQPGLSFQAKIVLKDEHFPKNGQDFFYIRHLLGVEGSGPIYTIGD
jgi:hypothetical protein